MQFLDALEKEKLGVNIIPHLCTIARKIVPETRYARFGIAIFLADGTSWGIYYTSTLQLTV